MGFKGSVQLRQQFVEDSKRLCERALQCLLKLEKAQQAQASKALVEPLIQELMGLVHTLKGVTLMMAGAEFIGHNLHELEDLLSYSSVKKMSLDWLPDAREILESSYADVRAFADTSQAA